MKSYISATEQCYPLLVQRSTFFFFASLCFQRFLQRFIDPTSTEDENAGLDLNEPLYMQKLEEVGYLVSSAAV